MSMTTNLSGGGFGPSDEEIRAAGYRNAALVQADAFRDRNEAVSRAQAFDDAAKARLGYVMRHYGMAGGGQPGASPWFTRAAVNSQELGTPGSYKGGAGAPEPIAVMRGGSTTFAPINDTSQEFLTPKTAQMAYNRGAGVGEYISPEKEKLDMMANTPEGKLKAAQAKLYERAYADKESADRVTAFEGSIKSALPKLFDDKGKMLPQFQGAYQEALNLAKKDPEGAVKFMQVKYYENLMTPENVNKAFAWMVSQGQDVKGLVSFMDQNRENPQAIAEKIGPQVERYLEKGRGSHFSRWGAGAGAPTTANALSPDMNPNRGPLPVSPDPAENNMMAFARRVDSVGRGLASGGEAMIRGFALGARQVIPGFYKLVDEGGRFRRIETPGGSGY